MGYTLRYIAHIGTLLCFVAAGLYYGFVFSDLNFKGAEVTLGERIMVYLARASIGLTSIYIITTSAGYILFGPFERKSRKTLTQCLTEFNHNLYFRFVTRGTNGPEMCNNVRHAYDVLNNHLPRDRWLIEIITDTSNDIKENINIQEIVVPDDYKTPNNTQYKARALQYALENSTATDNDFIIHLDEETRFTRQSVNKIMEYITQELEYAVDQEKHRSHRVRNWISFVSISIFIFWFTWLCFVTTKSFASGFNGTYKENWLDSFYGDRVWKIASLSLAITISLDACLYMLWSWAEAPRAQDVPRIGQGTIVYAKESPRDNDIGKAVGLTIFSCLAGLICTCLLFYYETFRDIESKGHGLLSLGVSELLSLVVWFICFIICVKKYGMDMSKYPLRNMGSLSFVICIICVVIFESTQSFDDIGLVEYAPLTLTVGAMITLNIGFVSYHIVKWMVGWDSPNGLQHYLNTMADSIRVADDYGKFRLQFQGFNMPYVGMKGSFIVIQNKIEKDVGFDYGFDSSITEDAFFALKAADMGYRFNFVNTKMYERSPFSVWDFIKQRRRWFGGLWIVATSTQLSKRKYLLKFLIILWGSSVLVYIFLAFSAFYMSVSSPHMNSFFLGVIFSMYVYNYFFGFVSSYDWKWDVTSICKYFILLGTQILFVITPVFSTMEMLGVLAALVNPPQNFELVQKGRNETPLPNRVEKIDVSNEISDKSIISRRTSHYTYDVTVETGLTLTEEDFKIKKEFKQDITIDTELALSETDYKIEILPEDSVLFEMYEDHGDTLFEVSESVTPHQEDDLEDPITPNTIFSVSEESGDRLIIECDEFIEISLEPKIHHHEDSCDDSVSYEETEDGIMLSKNMIGKHLKYPGKRYLYTSKSVKKSVLLNTT